ncbi:MAG: hypothetical protein CVV44_15375 [Spirochaetae bacterium HGW-Spirochaetae-1]|jgi:chromosome segregation protein|nr:MAG: hypothetical protein CVV44_15375 [Spirochaetae bacterium HGW-Spirochaetae-1]
MFLKSMELFGFKSFADRTMVQFEPGITAIVGPNGCGKSNIVDAIKWALGEKQAKNIRGSKMEDIIFSGTDNRKPVSLSEVSVTIDNTERILDFDADSVTVGRRIFRDGESEYLINKSPVRLKDIEKLFMDTGIGKSAYSVMEQGKMDLILSTRAEDRRYLFEEAAGISRFKMQKKESIRKLEETGENLKRLNDVIKEIEREKDLKAKQADKTKDYLLLRDQLQDLDIKLNILKFRDLDKRLTKVQDDINRLKEEREKISVRVSSISSENEKDEKRKNDIQHQLWELDKRLDAYKIRVEDIDKKTDMNRRSIAEQEEHRAGVDKKIQERTENRKRLLEEKLKTEKSEVDIRGKVESDKVKLANLFESRKRKIESIHKSRDTIEENKRLIKEKEEILKKLREALEVVVKQLIDAIDKRKAELQGSEDERQQVRGIINETLNSMDELLRKARQSLEVGMAEEAVRYLAGIDIILLRNNIQKFESYEDGFRSILFDKTGIHARKEELDRKIKAETDAIDGLRSQNSMLDEFIQNEQAELEDINGMITRIEKDLSKFENDIAWIEKHLQSLGYQIKDMDMQIENHREDMQRSEKIMKNLKNEIQEWENRLIEFNEKSNALMKNITEFTSRRQELEQKIHDRKNISRKDEEELSKIVDRIGNLEKSTVELMFKKSNIEDYIWVDYEKKVEEFSKVVLDESQLNDIQSSLQGVKGKISDLGPINNLAIEEFKDLKKRFEYFISQKKDIESAREDILSVIEDINKTSVDLFLDTFKEIQKNFSQIFRQLFEGGDAMVELTDPENILDSGIDIMVRPPGKKAKNINLLSGGERALTAIALLFATYMVKPSPFCFLDEIDAPLDEENIGRFLKMLREFAKGTQFIIVTHNKKTMSIGASIYGVTMEEAGVSKVVSLQMNKVANPN